MVIFSLLPGAKTCQPWVNIAGAQLRKSLFMAMSCDLANHLRTIEIVWHTGGALAYGVVNPIFNPQ